MTDVEARDLKPGQRIAAGFLPLKGEAVVLYVKPYPIHAVTRVFVVYEYTDVDAYGIQPTPDDYLPDTLIPVVGPACCIDAEASHGEPEILHTGGCPNRCATPVPCITSSGLVTDYPCALTTGHPPDHWIPSGYTRRTPHPAESSFGWAATVKDSPDPMYPEGEPVPYGCDGNPCTLQHHHP